jgi:Predicted transcriptional regulators
MNTGSDDDVRQIGEVAELIGLSLRTLRHYDDIDLVTPSARSEGGYRLYTAEDVNRLLLIRRMKPLGYTLADMRQVIALLDAGEEADAHQWEQVVAEADQRRADLSAKVAMADDFLQQLHQHSHSRPVRKN